MELPNLINDISCDDEDRVSVALRELFARSEDSKADERIVHALLDLVSEREAGSVERNLGLLILNNLSIPTENKRVIAIDCGGVELLCPMLCKDPSCHLISIILVNLTFSDVELRKELVTSGSGLLLDTLVYAFLAASTGNDSVEGVPVSSPREMRLAALEKDLASTKRIHSETSVWCLQALKNLTRPSGDPSSAEAVINSGIVEVLLKILTPLPPNIDINTDEHNLPCVWESNSIEDASLFILLNLSYFSKAREYLRKSGAAYVLSLIADCIEEDPTCIADGSDAISRRHQFQCLKARMALSYLVGAEGYFGQPRRKKDPNSHKVPEGQQILNMTGTEAVLLMELLDNTMHNRGKEGPGGYSSVTFSLKAVIYAIRCLLTSPQNQVTCLQSVGVSLNILFLKVVAMHSILHLPTVDDEAAEYASFSLYLLSTYCFEDNCFLSLKFAGDEKGKNSLIEKVLGPFLEMPGITAAGYHAATQILLRSSYLKFEDSPNQKELGPHSDYEFSEDLLEACKKIVVREHEKGVKPKKDIISRPILRSQIPNCGGKSPWADQKSFHVYPSALAAVESISFGSVKARHVDVIDDILVANNIANSAKGEKTEAYDYWWIWEDAASGINEKIQEVETSDGMVMDGFSMWCPMGGLKD